MTQSPEPQSRILIASDNQQDVELLKAYLAETTFELRTVADGEKAFRDAATWLPDLIVLDIVMPLINGFEVCKRLRANPATRGIAVLMTTGLDEPSDSDIARAVEAGTDDLLSKPINKTEFLIRIGSFLSR